MDRYIYCINDFEQAIIAGLGEMFGDELNNIVQEKIVNELRKYVNLYRFYDRNCPGCVCGNRECDFAYGRDKAKGAWEKAKNGELFDCPVRVNGSMIFSRSEGIKTIDISDRDKPPYPIIK